MTQEVKEGLGELADVAERDHEVQMARADLYKLAKYAIKLHDMLKGVSEAEGLEGWVQSKITKSADMIGSVYHHLDYEESPMAEGKGIEAMKKAGNAKADAEEKEGHDDMATAIKKKAKYSKATKKENYKCTCT